MTKRSRRRRSARRRRGRELSGMLGDDGETEAGTLAVPRRRPLVPRENRSKTRLRSSGDAGPRSSTAIRPTCRRSRRSPGWPAGVALGVLEQVGTMRSKRLLSTSTRRCSAASWMSMKTGGGDAATVCRTRAPRATSSVCQSPRPASRRDISSRSSTRRRKRPTSAPSRSRAWRARSGSSSRRACTTERDVASVVRGERNSWLTSE